MKILLSIILTLNIGLMYAQGIKEISKRYEEVNNGIKQSIDQFKKGEPEGAHYYTNELVVNKNNKQWPAVGIYKKTITFWYTDDPNHNEDEDGISVLDKITVVENSTYTQNSEYLFNDKGELIFYYFFYIHNSGKPDKEEYRFYYTKSG